jgi:hypothetical protein
MLYSRHQQLVLVTVRPPAQRVPEIKRTGREADHSACVAEIKNACRCTVSALASLWLGTYQIKHKEKCTNFTLTGGIIFRSHVSHYLDCATHIVTITDCTWSRCRCAMHELNSSDAQKILRRSLTSVILNSE